MLSLSSRQAEVATKDTLEPTVREFGVLPAAQAGSANVQTGQSR